MFFKVQTSEEVLDILRKFLPGDTEHIHIGDALNRVLGRDVFSDEDLPGFPRSAMDGYTLCAKDTYGASDMLPAFLEVTGEILMGESPVNIVTPGTAIRISTGSMIPEGADAVVMVEYCQNVDENTIEVTRSVAPLENIINRGDDFKKGSMVFPKGAALRPQDIGILAGLGIDKVIVYQKPTVAIISTGDEIIPINKSPKPGQVRDINSYTLSAFCDKAGAVPVRLGLCKDNFEQMREMVACGLDSCASVWISGGSSVGTRDMTLKVLESFPDMHLLAHGIAISPGKPTIIAQIGTKAVFGLPGHVASALVVAEIFLNPFLAKLSGKTKAFENHHLYANAELARNVESVSGRDDYIRVKLIAREGRLFAAPVFGKSGLISTLVEADGLVKIDRHSEGLYQGQNVRVLLFEPFEGEATP